MKKKTISLFEIIILVISTFAFAYIFSDRTNIVSAQVPAAGCCEVTKLTSPHQGAKCLEVSEDECESGFAPNVACEDTVSCKLGCCVNQRGECNSRTPKSICQETGRWIDSDECNTPDCQRGCCVLGTQTTFVTEATCAFLSDTYGLEKDYRAQISSELLCVALSYSLQEGSCTYEQQGELFCRYLTYQECQKIPGANFERGRFCAEILPGKCIGGFETRCVDGKDSIYYFDSCGNKENLVEKCDRFNGTTCALNDDGEPYCKSLDCQNIPSEMNGGKSYRKNGESWCVYEGSIDNGRDVPGSSHYKFYCIDGDVKHERCEEGRAKICEEDHGQNFSSAMCRPNLAFNCLKINSQYANDELSQSGLVTYCNQNPHCEVTSFENLAGADDMNPEIKLCVPKHPRGILNRNSDEAETLCSAGTFVCSHVELDDFWTGWECEEGCDCLKDKTSDYANEKFCTRVGDCGVYTNLAGKTTSGGMEVKQKKEDCELNTGTDGDWDCDTDYNRVIGFPGGYVGTYGIYANTDPEKDIPVSNFDYLMDSAGIQTDPGILDESMEDILDDMDFTGTPWEHNPEAFWFGAVLTSGIAGGIIGGAGGIGSLTGEFAGGTALGAAFLGGLIGGFSAYIVNEIFGDYLSQDAMDFLTFTGVGVGVGIGIGAAAGGGLGTTFSTAFWGGMGVLLISLLVLGLIFAAVGQKAKVKTNTYNCDPYEPPAGGADCERCPNLGVKDECTMYKCQSLGKACGYFEEEGVGKCAEIDINDNIPPEIQGPWQIILEESETIASQQSETGYKLDKNNNQCFVQFEKVWIGIQTDELGKCRYDFNSTTSSTNEKTNFQNMGYSFPGGFAFNHSAEIRLSDYGLGDLNMYIRCQDRRENTNVQEYVIKTCVNELDLTSPFIIKSEPENNGYIKYGEDSVNVTLELNEPSDCKWSKVNEIYDSMENLFACTDITMSVDSFICKATLTGLVDETNSVFIRCQDKWIEPNTNTQSHNLTLHASDGPLDINVVSPEPGSEVIFGRILELALELETSGGAQGVADCEYSFTGYESMVPFAISQGVTHKQRFDLLGEGDHKIYIQCKDSARNIAQKETTFKISKDTSPPKITRSYKQDINLYIETNEESVCKYSFDDCNFEFDDGIDMTGIGREHQTLWKVGKTYYIRCKDLWDNMPDKCTIELKTT